MHVKVFYLAVIFLPALLANMSSAKQWGYFHSQQQLPKNVATPYILYVPGQPSGYPVSSVDYRAGNIVHLIIFRKTDIFPYSDCTGTIISDSHILTAAQCFNLEDIERVEVIMGTTLNVANPIYCSLSNAPSSNCPINFIKRTVLRNNIIIHKDFNIPVQMSNDIAILKLHTPIDFKESPSVSIAKLDVSNGMAGLAATATVVTAMGWGSISTNGGVPPLLLQTELMVNNQQNCNSQFPNLYNAAKQICIVPEQYKGTCNSDSGGPIYLNDVQVGITSFRNGPCESGGVYTRISAYADWINKIVGQSNKQNPTQPSVNTDPIFWWLRQF